MTTEVLYFGMIAERLGKNKEHLDLNEVTELRPFFEALYPDLASMSYQIAVNQTISDVVPEGEEINEIALLPPFAGG